MFFFFMEINQDQVLLWRIALERCHNSVSRPFRSNLYTYRKLHTYRTIVSFKILVVRGLKKMTAFQ